MMGRASVLLDRLDQFLSAEATDPSRDAIGRVLRRPWRNLEHQTSGDEDVRDDESTKLADLAEAENRVRRDYTGRFAIELLQNAHDACADGKVSGQAWVEVTDTAMLVGNTGLPFDAERVGSLLRLGGSSKKRSDGHHTIGYKGIGFSSVFEITDEPQIISSTTQFCFHREAAATRVKQKLRLGAGKVPVRRFPFPLVEADWADDADAVGHMLSSGAVTVIRLPLLSRHDAAHIKRDVIESLPPEVLLFMPALRSLSVPGRDELIEWRRTMRRGPGLGNIETLRTPSGLSEKSYLTLAASCAVPKETTDALDDELWSDVKKVGAAIAVPWDRGKPEETDVSQPLHVYFPTDDILGRNLLVHGDFYVDSSRRHIEDTGPGGAISALVTDCIADLVAQAATKLAHHGNRLLRCLAALPDDPASGYGRRVAASIDRRLAETPFCRIHGGQRLAAPAAIARMGTGIEEKLEARLAGMIRTNKGLLRVGDDSAVEDWLEGLGCNELSPDAIARGLDPRLDRKLSYSQVLETVAEWWQTVPSWRLVNSGLSQRPLVQDTAGRWRMPSEVVVPDSRVPALPSPIRPKVYAAPRSAKAKEFVAQVLDVPEMSKEHAVELLLTAVNDGRFGRNDDERRAALEFLFHVWKSSERVLGRLAGSLRQVEVPVRTHSQRKAHSWRPASRTYYSRRDVADSRAEQIYGPLEVEEFLVDDHHEQWSDWHRFYDMLGVAASPRTVDFDVNSLGWQKFRDWRYESSVERAYECADGHPNTERIVRTKVLDRLSELIERGDRKSLVALATYLASTEAPYGPDATISCAHSAHRQRNWKKAVGFQRLLLQRAEWIAVREPDGSDGLTRPDEAWFDLTNDTLAGLVPVAELTEVTCERLELVSAASPGRASLETLLERLAQSFPDLNTAPEEAKRAAEWLLHRLESAPATNAAERPPRLPARQGGRLTWSTEPLVADVPALDNLDLAHLPTGTWRGLRQAYGLKLASERVTVTPRLVRSDGPSHPLITNSFREQLVALLTARGDDIARLARRVALLTEIRCERLSLTIGVDGTKASEVAASFHLQERRSAGGRVSGALFFVVDPLPRSQLPAVADCLADYLGTRHHDAVTSFLALGADLLAAQGLGDTALTDARHALAEYPKRTDNVGLFETPAEEVRTRDLEATDETAGVASPDNAAGPPTDSSEPESPQDPETNLDWSDDWPDQPDRSPSKSTANTGTGDSGTHPFKGLPSATETAERRRIDASLLTFGAQAPARQVPNREPLRPRSGFGSVSGNVPSTRTTGRDRDETDADAMAIFMEFAKAELGATVERVDHLNLGWDAELTIGDQKLLVEVKGHLSSSSTFMITRNERRAALEQDGFRVVIVEGIGNRKGTIALIHDTSLLLEDDRLSPMSWQVANWTDMPHTIRPWTAD